MDGRIPTMASATYNTPLWQRGASTPTTYANEPTSPTSVGGSADANTPVGFEGHPQVQVGKPENAWRYVSLETVAVHAGPVELRDEEC